ncbi:MAG TPA: hypothetical protein DD789_01790 [Firmicutes bacterium]|nr:hypothetical protein [Bacillota bacterium]
MTKFGRCLMIFILTLILFIINVQEVKADSSGFFSFGYGGKDKAFSLSFAGRIDRHFGLEVGLIFSGELSGHHYKYPCPIPYTIVGEKKVEPACGIDMLGIIDLTDNITLHGGIGIYRQKYALVSRSTSAANYYWQSTEYKYDGGLSVGIQFTSDKGLLGLGYHQLRGVNIQFASSLSDK